MLNFAQSFGLILFVYSLGLQVGSGFFSSLKKGGVAMNMMGLGCHPAGIAHDPCFPLDNRCFVAEYGRPALQAVTNTPALGAAGNRLYYR